MAKCRFNEILSDKFQFGVAKYNFVSIKVPSYKLLKRILEIVKNKSIVP